MRIFFEDGRSVLLKEVDLFVIKYMLGIICQGHGTVRVRGIVPAIVYLRSAYGLNLRDASDAVLGAEKKLIEI